MGLIEVGRHTTGMERALPVFRRDGRVLRRVAAHGLDAYITG